MAVHDQLKLLKTLVSLVFLFSVCRRPITPSSYVDRIYSPLLLANTTNILFAGDVDEIKLNSQEISGILVGLTLMTSLRGAYMIMKKLNRTCVVTMSWTLQT